MRQIKEIILSCDDMIIPLEKQQVICSYLDSLNRIKSSNYLSIVAPSSLYYGAIQLISSKIKNSDYIAQAAHSLREILYHYTSDADKRKEIIKKLIQRFKLDGNEQEIEEIASVLNELHFLFTQIAHHFNDYSKHDDFVKGMNNLRIPIGDVRKFNLEHFKKMLIILTNAWYESLPRQISLHKLIDDLLSCNQLYIDKDVVSLFLSFNNDSYQYFFNQVDEKWLDWLWGNKFLDAIKQKAKDSTRISYTMPELNYLAKVAEKEPEKVTDIILSVPISQDTFNPEVIDRFLWICSSSLPAEQIARLVDKIKKDEWVKLMYPFRQWGFEYEKIFEKLMATKDYKSVITLAEAVLMVRNEEKMASRGYAGDNPFYFNDLWQTKIFEYLTLIDDSKSLEEALKLTINVLKEIILTSDRKDENGIFDIQENFYLLDADLFTLKLKEKNNLSYRDDLKNFLATIKELIEKIISGYCKDEAGKIKALYKTQIVTLPFTRITWRLQLFTMSLCPVVFKDDMKVAFFKIFEEHGRYYNLLYAEYLKTLKVGFSSLSEELDQKQYIQRVFDYFGEEREDKKEEESRKRDGLKILSCIINQLTLDDKKISKEKLGQEPTADYKPGSEASHMRGGFVSPKAPINLETLSKMPIPELVEKLSNIWTPKGLYEMDKQRDFLNPLSAEGMGSKMQQDIANRVDQYILNAKLFFDPKKLDLHYTYSFFRGVYDVIHEGKFLKDTNFENLVALIEDITKSGREDDFKEKELDRDKYDTWLAGWSAVYNVVSDIIKELLEEKDGATLINFLNYRTRILEIIKYLFSYPDPTTEENFRENGSDPFITAINSVRGRAFEALTLFIYQDGKQFSKEDKIKISKEVKELYQKVLEKEETFAVMFMYGRYLPSFYYRDKERIKGLLPKVFPEKNDDLYLAAWEGYLSASLYGDMFTDFSDLYERAIKFDSVNYTKRRYSIELDDGLATHLALAFVHFKDFTLESSLFNLFWDTSNIKRHKYFVSFIGRHVISRDNPAAFISENKIDIEKIKGFWEWLLKKGGDSEIFAEFGFWMNNQGNIYNDLKWLAERIFETLNKSGGIVDWDYALIKILPELAKKAPRETLEILKLYLLSGKLKPAQSTYRIGDLLEVFNILYSNKDLEKDVYDFINELWVKGGSTFWRLGEIIK